MSLIREYSNGGGSRWHDRQESYSVRQTAMAEEDPEAEIAASAFVDDDEFESDPVNAGSRVLDERESNYELVEEHSRMHGFDGEELSDDEQLHTSMYGHDQFDRPLELERLEDAADYIEELEERLAAESAALDRVALGTSDIPMPIDQARANVREQARQQLINNADMVFVDRAAEDRYMDQIEQQNIQQQLAEARAHYGEEFDEAYQRLTSLNPNNPRDRALVRQIVYSGYRGAHVGETLIGWHRDTQATRQGRPHPQQQRTIRHGMLVERGDSPRRGQAYRSLEQEIEDNGGYSSAEDEADVFANAFR